MFVTLYAFRKRFTFAFYYCFRRMLFKNKPLFVYLILCFSRVLLNYQSTLNYMNLEMEKILSLKKKCLYGQSIDVESKAFSAKHKTLVSVNSIQKTYL